MPAYAGSLYAGRTDKPRKRLKIELATKLKYSWIECRGNLAKVVRPEGSADLVELGVVPGVEALGAQLKPTFARLAQNEALEQRKIPVVAARAPQGVVPCSAPVAEGGRSERPYIEPLADLVRIRNTADLIRTVGGVDQAVTTLTTRQLRVNR